MSNKFYMNDGNNINDLIKKAQEMIKNDEVPNEIKELVNNMSKNSNNNSSRHENQLSSNIDIAQLMNIANSLNKETSNDDMSRLLFALKPYLRNEKRGKIDEYIKLIKMGKMAKLLDNLNNSPNK